MQSFVLSEDSAGTVWATTQCQVCGEVHKYAPADFFAEFVTCKGCNQPTELSGEVVAMELSNEGGVRL
jgi:hypothetical protein